MKLSPLIPQKLMTFGEGALTTDVGCAWHDGTKSYDIDAFDS